MAAAVVREPLVLAVVARAHLPVLALAQVVAHRVHRVALRRLARWPVSARVLLPVLAARPVVAGLAVLVARGRVVAALVVVAAVRLPNRRWSSAAMARTTP